MLFKCLWCVTVRWPIPNSQRALWRVISNWNPGHIQWHCLCKLLCRTHGKLQALPHCSGSIWLPLCSVLLCSHHCGFHNLGTSDNKEHRSTKPHRNSRHAQQDCGPRNQKWRQGEDPRYNYVKPMCPKWGKGYKTGRALIKIIITKYVSCFMPVQGGPFGRTVGLG